MQITIICAVVPAQVDKKARYIILYIKRICEFKEEKITTLLPEEVDYHTEQNARRLITKMVYA